MHWVYKRKPFVPDPYKFGFVYKKKPSGWETYTGSSKHLNSDMGKLGKKHFTFQIIGEYENKRSLKYYECFYQMKFKVLTAVLEGTDEPAYYNNYVGGKFYRPIRVEK
jgi:hypothetical protein